MLILRLPVHSHCGDAMALCVAHLTLCYESVHVR